METKEEGQRRIGCRSIAQRKTGEKRATIRSSPPRHMEDPTRKTPESSGFDRGFHAMSRGGLGRWGFDVLIGSSIAPHVIEVGFLGGPEHGSLFQSPQRIPGDHLSILCMLCPFVRRVSSPSPSGERPSSSPGPSSSLHVPFHRIASLVSRTRTFPFRHGSKRRLWPWRAPSSSSHDEASTRCSWQHEARRARRDVAQICEWKVDGGVRRKACAMQRKKRNPCVAWCVDFPKRSSWERGWPSINTNEKEDGVRIQNNPASPKG